MKGFVHLHVHSQYSLLDGQASIPSLVDKAMADGMPGIAITDHGNMFGIKEFANYLKKANAKRPEGTPEFKGIYGCEMYVALKSRKEVADPKDKGRHLIVLAKNKQGYKNLIKLVSQAWTEGFYHHPRTDMESLEKYKEGLIVASACLGGHLPRLIQAGDLEQAEAHARKMQETFGDDYYIELQRHPTNKPGGRREVFEIQQKVNVHLIEIAHKLGIKLIATNDVHFTNEEDAEAHDRLICISTNSKVTDERRMRYTKQEWMKSTAEMEELFKDIPEALENTLEVLDKVEPYSIDHGPIMPFFEIPAEFGTEEEYRQRFSEQDLKNEFTRDENGNEIMSDEEADKKIQKMGGYEKLYRIKFEADYLAKLAYEGATKRYGENLSDELRERLKFELHIMKTMGFPGYFLIVQDFIKAARERLGVSVGPGRGSAAGSCVAYCLGITQIDPIKYDLLFERFLNPDRISLPDIDLDFDDDGREDVLRYVTEKYGEEKVAHIITYGTMAAKMAIKDVARVVQLPLSESDRLTKLIPAHLPEVNGKEPKPTVENLLKYVPELRAEMDSDNPLVRETLEYARQLDGNVRNSGVHACGVIICRDDITDWVPISTAVDKAAADKEKSRQIVTQYEGSVIEETGLIKMDFLGLKTLSIIKEAVRNIKNTTGKDIDIDAIDIDDRKTYELYCNGSTVGTFQFESAGMQKYLRELRPSTFEDLIAMNALYRPGPMEYIPEFIARKHGRSPIQYDIPEMEKYLKDTYGVTVYQEQVMLLSRSLAGFTRGQSDTLRKAMGKKMKDKMDALKELFLKGGQERGHDGKVLDKIWADWEKFASYAFNKSHSTCYSWVAFQTAWLKANYPSEYMAAVLTRNLSDTTKLSVMMDECKQMKIPVKGPDINESFVEFGVNKKGDIRFGLAAIKGVGENVVKAIIETRDQGGPFESIYDFVERVPYTAINRRVMDALALAGAFDCFSPEVNREDFFEATSKGETFSEALLHYAQAYQNDKHNAQFSLFGDDEISSTAGRPKIVHGPMWVSAERLRKERDLVGMYLSAHPLDPFFIEVNYGATCSLKEFSEQEGREGADVMLCGMVVSLESRTSRTGAQFGILKLEDYSGSAEIVLSQKAYMQYRMYGISGTPVFLTGRFERFNPQSPLRFNIYNMQLLDEVKGKLASGLTINVNACDLGVSLGQILKDNLSQEVGKGVPMNFIIKDTKNNVNLPLRSSKNISLTRPLIDALQSEGIDFSVQRASRHN